MRLDELITLRHLEKRLEEGEEKSVEILYRFLFNNKNLLAGNTVF